MIVDVLNLVAPSPQFMATSYLASTVPGQNPTITYLSEPSDDGVRDLVYMKGLSGYPWDWMTVTDSWIRQRLTERAWANPHTGKLNFGLGVRRLPRRIIRGEGDALSLYQWTMASPETDYLIFDPAATGNSILITRNTDAGVRCTFRGPYAGAAIGMLPAGEDWFEDYEWGGQNGVYSVKETIAHRVGYGRYQWQSFDSDGKGGYEAVPSASSEQTQIVPLVAPVKPFQRVF